MSRIAEQKALEAYPPCINSNGFDLAEARREGYIQGYDQAMQDFLEKSFEWLEMKIICYSKREYEELIEQFKNYMQDEN